MNIAIIGGNGFIGRHIACAVEQNADSPVVFARQARGTQHIDLAQTESAQKWKVRLQDANIGAVINCVGVLQGTPVEMDAIHHRSPAAIAAACRALRIPFLHIGVAGFYDSPKTPYFQSKRRGEEAIRIANPGAIIVRPSVVFGLDSPATQILLRQAASPVFVLPVRTKPIAPIHIDDLATLCAYLVGTIRAQGRDIDVVGDTEMTIADYLGKLRAARNQSGATSRPATLLALPNALFRFFARIAAALGSKTFCPEVTDLMEHAHIGQPGAISHWLHRPGQSVAQFQQRENMNATQANLTQTSPMINVKPAHH